MPSTEVLRRRSPRSPLTARVAPPFDRLTAPCASRWALALVAVVLVWGPAVTGSAEEIEYDPDVVLVIKDKAFHVLKGAAPDQTLQHPTFLVPTGMDVILMLRNEDSVAHEFVSPLLQKVDLRISGRATLVYTHTAAGVRVEPHEAVILRFDVPGAGYDQFQFWCNVHGKLQGDRMRGEIFVLKESAQ